MSIKSERINVNCKQCGIGFLTTQKRLDDNRGKFCSVSCGAKFNSKKHGHSTHSSQSRTYTSWANMIQRCNNPNATKYPMYGAKGIKVCSEWLDFEKFLKDMGERPENHTIDRINGNDGYYPGNCRWSSIKEQQNNLKSNVIVKYNNTDYTLQELSKILNIKPPTLLYRIKRGWSEKELSSKPKQGKTRVSS